MTRGKWIFGLVSVGIHLALALALPQAARIPAEATAPPGSLRMVSVGTMAAPLPPVAQVGGPPAREAPFVRQEAESVPDSPPEALPEPAPETRTILAEEGQTAPEAAPPSRPEPPAQEAGAVEESAGISSLPPSRSAEGAPGGVEGALPEGKAGGVPGGEVAGGTADTAPEAAPEPQGERGPAAPIFYPAESLEAPPAVTRKAELRYPEEARRRGLEGAVLVEIDIDRDGKVMALRAVASSDPIFIEPALAMLKACVYSPGRAGGRAVPTRLKLTVRFKLR